MARYIDADNTIKVIRDKFNIYFEVPCDSDDRRVQEIIGKVKNIIQEQSTADVVPKSEVDRLTVELEAMRTAANSYKMHYENLAREIFEEIGKILFKHTNIAIAQKSVTCELAIDYIGEDIAELKKKYENEVLVVRDLVEEAVNRDITNYLNQQK